MDRRGASLDALNLFLADVRDGLGPYLAIYLLTERHWTPDRIGFVMTVAGLAGLAAQAPAGWLVDQVRAKRTLLIAAALAVALSCLALPALHGFPAVAASQSVAAIGGGVFGPGVAALTLGLVGVKAFARRTGRNEVFNHLGNALAAGAAGGLALIAGPVGVFWLLGGMALASVLALLWLPGGEIDPNLARGLDAEADGERDRPSGLADLLRNRPLMVFALCAALFHLANGAMLPLVGQELAKDDAKSGTALMSACIVGAQVVMVPMAALAGARADAWGRKPLLLAGFAALPVRGVLYTLSDDRWWLLAVQCMDGIGAGLFGALFPVIVGDLTRGTGRFNAAQGATSALFGVGAALSPGLAGAVAARFGYHAAFLVLAAIAAIAAGLLLALVPETRDCFSRGRSHPPRSTPAPA